MTRHVASLTDLDCAIVRGALDRPPDLDFGELVLGLLDSPLVTEPSDRYFPYTARITPGVASTTGLRSPHCRMGPTDDT